MIIKDFRYNPILRELLINYIYRTYEENSITDDYHLMMEYNLLLNENRLNDLFAEEQLINYLADGNDLRG